MSDITLDLYKQRLNLSDATIVRIEHDHISLLLSADGPCTIHRDFRPGNLIAQNNKLQGIIDWASARASFAEYEHDVVNH